MGKLEISLGRTSKLNPLNIYIFKLTQNHFKLCNETNEGAITVQSNNQTYIDILLLENVLSSGMR